MRQILYISDSLIGSDEAALTRLLVQARHNNTMNGLSGLLWTDGDRFAQILEGDEGAVANVFMHIAGDSRHTNVMLLESSLISQTQFGSWSMAMPAREGLADVYEARARMRLRTINSPAAHAFLDIIGAEFA